MPGRDQARRCPNFTFSGESKGNPIGEPNPLHAETSSTFSGESKDNPAISLGQEAKVCGAAPAGVACSPTSEPCQPPQVEERFEVRFSIDADAKEKLEEAQVILSGKFPRGVKMENVFKVTLELFLETYSPKRRMERRAKRAAARLKVAKLKAERAEKLKAKRLKVEQSKVEQPETKQSEVEKQEVKQLKVEQSEIGKQEIKQLKVEQPEIEKSEVEKQEVKQSGQGSNATDLEKINERESAEGAQTKIGSSEPAQVKSLEPSPEKPGTKISRHLPRHIRDMVYVRDEGRCTFVSPDGRRCEERCDCEIHHVEPYGRGGAHDLSNLRLYCRAHNLHQAEKDYGKDYISAKIQAARACEQGASGVV